MPQSKSTKTVRPLTRFAGGIAEYDREGTTPDNYAFGRSVDVRTNPQNVTILPAAVKESGTIITALPKWGEYISKNSNTYIYDESGNIYLRDSTATYTNIHTVPTSHGNGMAYFGEDDQMYFTSDKTIGRFGPMSSSTPQFVDDFFASQGGTPLNINSLSLTSSSSMYASRASTAALQITGDLTTETYIYPTTLPSSGNLMTLISKWDASGTTLSYRFSLGTSNNFFGSGTDGALTISADTTDAPIDSSAVGTVATSTLTATNVSFAANQMILIIQMQGTGAGNHEINTIQSYTAGTITTVSPLKNTYISSGTSTAQVLVIKQYGNVTVNAGKTWTAKAWNGTVGGILAFLSNGTLSVSGTITAVGCGFRGASAVSGTNTAGKQGESYNSSTYNSASINPNGGAGGGGLGGTGLSGGAAGGGGSYATVGATWSQDNGGGPNYAYNGQGNNGGVSNGSGLAGAVYGGQDLTSTLYFGSGGGSGGTGYSGGTSGSGGAGGGILLLGAPTVTINSGGSVISDGQRGQIANLGNVNGAGGAGSAGSVLLYTQTGTLGRNLTSAQGANGGYNTNGYPIPGGASGTGRIHIDYLTSYTGTSTPTLYATTDTNLGSSSGYTLQLSLSSDGTTISSYTKPVTLVINTWAQVGAAFSSANKSIEFFLNGTSLGTVSTGSLNTIHSNASKFALGTEFDGSGNATNFFNGLIDEARVWAVTLAASDVSANYNKLVNTSAFGLKGYWRLEGDYTDASGNSNTLTATNSPTFSTNVPFSAPTTRVDLDQTGTGTGNSYTLPTTIAETTANKQVFTPTKDPQKSVEVYVTTKGTGNWTMTVHDQYNVAVATTTVANASLPTSGLVAFIFSTPWRPLTNFTNNYHFHMTSSDGTGAIQTQSAGDMSNSTYNTYFSFLVEDDYFHPVFNFLNMQCFGNERYVATLSATIYNPNSLVLPSGWRVWSFSLWNEYLAIGCIYGTTPLESDKGRIFFWDGYSQVYNFFVDIPTGGVTALKNVNTSTLTAFTGYQGDMVTLQPGNIVYGTQSSMIKVRRIPKVDDTTSTYVYPGAVASWKGLFRFGVAGSSTSTLVQKGIYTWGAINSKYPEILTFDYPLSSGVLTGTNVRVGMVLAVNQNLLVGWQSNSGYGVDVINANNPCATSATIECMVVDDNAVWKQKELNTIVAKVQTLASGQSIQLRYMLDDASVWTLGETTSSTSTENNVARFIIPDGRYFEQQIAIDLYSTSGVTPLLKGLGIESDMKADEVRLG